VPYSPLQRAKISLGREVEHPGDLLHSLVERPLDAASETEDLYEQALNLGVLQELCETRVLEQTNDAFPELDHGGVAD